MVLERERKKKTRVVCTIGPASENEKMLKKLILAGMNVMRLNFSHGDFEEHGGRIKTVRKLNKELNKNVAILLDTKGPEIRTGDFVGGSTEFKKGQVSTICVEDIEGTSEKFTITYKDLYKDVKPGGFILVNDGQVELLVDHVEGTDIVCVAANDGVVKNKRGINVPGIKLGFDYLSDKDIGDLTFGCEQGVDFIAASFCRRAQDILDIKKLLIENGRPNIQIIAKIENQEGVENMDEILKVADGIMVARGDLGVEVPAEDVPLIQKELINKCKAVGKVVITATQMLDSMQENPRPTRAEVSDVANAIYDGTDAIMLSGESAQGKYPEEAVMTMTKIALKTEGTLDYAGLQRQAIETAPLDASEAICMSVAEIAYKFDVAAIIAFTNSGFTARKMSRYRPKSLIIAATPIEETTKALALNWGVKSVICKQMDTRAAMLDYAKVIAKENFVKVGEKILVTGGTPGVAGTTSYLELITVE
ncbi:MAG: pyruvate kinase [Thomasclavelia sp.]|jgi:pyruvate kinase|nr:pyruvate kinase [Thomasclavelia sp.]